MWFLYVRLIFVHHRPFMMQRDFLTPPPLFSAENKKCQGANESSCSMISFIYKSLWSTRWLLIILELNKGRGGQSKYHLV